MSVSIILPTYNGSRFLLETIEGVIKQSHIDWEMIVVDDGSTDQTPSLLAAVAESDRRVKVVSISNRGEAGARNAGFTISDSTRPYVIFLDHDDVWRPSCLTLLLRQLKSRPNAVGCHGLATLIGPTGEIVSPGYLEGWGRRRKRIEENVMRWCTPAEPTELATLTYHLPIATMGLCLLKRSSLPNSPFEEAMRTGSADLHLYLRLARSGVFTFLDDVVIYKRLHGNNLSNDDRAIDLSIKDAIARVWRSPDTIPEQRKAMELAYSERVHDGLLNSLKCARGAALRCRFRRAVMHLNRAGNYLRENSLQKISFPSRASR